jgi:hypothetical protein
MALLDRVKNILLTPKTEWPKVAEEVETTQSIYVGYVMILAAIGPIATVLRGGVVAMTVGAVTYAITLVVIYLLALIIDALAPNFGGEKNFIQSLKLIAYSHTVAWVAGIFHLLPFLGGVIGLLAAIYAFYTFYLGAPVLKKCTEDKAVAYTIVVALCAIVLGALITGSIMSVIVGGAAMSMMGFGMMH